MRLPSILATSITDRPVGSGFGWSSPPFYTGPVSDDFGMARMQALASDEVSVVRVQIESVGILVDLVREKPSDPFAHQEMHQAGAQNLTAQSQFIQMTKALG